MQNIDNDEISKALKDSGLQDTLDRISKTKSRKSQMMDKKPFTERFWWIPWVLSFIALIVNLASRA